MKPRITLKEVSTLEDSQFKVTFTVTNAANIEAALFTYNTGDDTFSHPATVFDIEDYPTTKAQAVEDNLAFYRANAVTRYFNNVDAANDFKEDVRARIQFVLNEFSKTQDDFEGTETYILESA